MPLETPNLDDRRFNEIFEELRSRIPRYAPEWTDHNDSDPGISLMHLFSWLGEMILFRLNRVPDLNYIRFLQLIGVERKSAYPAKAEVTFTLANPDAPPVIIPRGTQIGAEESPAPQGAGVVPALLSPEAEEPVVFETEEPLFALGAELRYVQAFDGINYVDYTPANTVTGEHYKAFGTTTREGSALLLGFASNNPFPTVEINLAVRIFTDPSSVREYTCDLTKEKVYTSVTEWEYWDGGQWRRLDVIKDETRALTISGHVCFNGPRDIKKAKLGAFTKADDKELYWIRCHLVRSYYDISPELDAVRINTVRATAVVTVRDEVVGSSNGQTNQRYLVRRTPVFAKMPRPLEERLQERVARKRTLNEAEQEEAERKLRERELIKGFLLEVDEGQGLKPWEEVEDFFNSEPDDRHYVLNRTTGEVRFGDGNQGHIPLAGINNIVVRYYRYGGGARGNVGAETITNLQTAVAGIDAVTNYWPAEGGADEEPVKDTKARAPKELKARDRAVTMQDFQFLAMQTPGVRVRRAHALPLYHPQFPEVEVPGVITVIIVPESKDPKPVPSEATMQTVCAYLNQRRLLTTEVFVAPPKYKQVKIEAKVLVKPAANLATVKRNIEESLTNYLHPITGGADGLGWPLGDKVLFSEVFRKVLQVEGVQYIIDNDLHIIIDGERKGTCKDAEIPKDYLVYSDVHEITVNYTQT